MTGTVLVYDPTAAVSRDGAPSVRRLDRLVGTTIGFIDNAKPNFNHLVDDLAVLLVERHGVATVVKRSKRGPSMPAADSMLDELAQQCDLVITGSGD